MYDASTVFSEKVVDYFINSYKKGETPNPCIMCNQFIKWGVLFDYAVDCLSADYIATGHYADIKNAGGNYLLYPAKDTQKDQLYFLYRLNQKHLKKTLFPLSKYHKSEIKQIAADYDLPSKDSKESQDICFIQKPYTAKTFLCEKFGKIKGDFIDFSTGKKLGEHSGCYQYTIGQRKGIGIAAPYPLYVLDIDPCSNIVYVGKEEENYKSELVISDINLTYPVCENEFDAYVKIRYNMPFKKAHVKISEDKSQILFYEPVNSVTKGQSCVIYDINDNHLIGGGLIG